MLQKASAKMLPLVNRAADVAPLAACCNACRTCMTTNIVGLATGGAFALVAAARGFGRRLLRVS